MVLIHKMSKSVEQHSDKVVIDIFYQEGSEKMYCFKENSTKLKKTLSLKYDFTCLTAFKYDLRLQK